MHVLHDKNGDRLLIKVNILFILNEDKNISAEGYLIEADRHFRPKILAIIKKKGYVLVC